MGAGIWILAALLAMLAAATRCAAPQLSAPDLFFHDCFVQVFLAFPCICISSIPFLSMLRLTDGRAAGTRVCVQGCDASVIIVSSRHNSAEKDNLANKSLAGDGFDTVIQAKKAVDAVEDSIAFLFSLQGVL